MTYSPAFGAVIIGDEILSGKRADAHLPKLIELLGERGCVLSWAEYVGDDPQRLTAVLGRACASTDVVFSFGGIGSTPDDHTRQCAARALGRPLTLHPEAAALINERMKEMAHERGETFDPASPEHQLRLQMGVFPEGSTIIPNPYNKIPGFTCRGPAGGWLHCVPGFPVMAWPMLAWALDTHHTAQQQRNSYEERSVILPGAIESTLTPLMQAIEARHPGIKVFSLPSVDHPRHGQHVELGIKGPAYCVSTAWDDLRGGLRDIPGIQVTEELVRRL